MPHLESKTKLIMTVSVNRYINLKNILFIGIILECNETHSEYYYIKSI